MRPSAVGRKRTSTSSSVPASIQRGEKERAEKSEPMAEALDHRQAPGPRFRTVTACVAEAPTGTAEKSNAAGKIALEQVSACTAYPTTGRILPSRSTSACSTPSAVGVHVISTVSPSLVALNSG